MTMFLVIISLISSAAIAITPQDLTIATQEMQKANYFTFVLLIKMAPFQGHNITFLMPHDRALSELDMSQTSVDDFLLRHSIPSPLLIDHLDHFPSGSMIPTSKPGFMFKVTNDGRRRFFLSNVRIISPNICTKGASIRCHGIDGVVQPVLMSQPNVPLTRSPPGLIAPSQPLDGGPGLAPAESPSGVRVNGPTSSSSGLGYGLVLVVLDLVLMFCVLVVA